MHCMHHVASSHGKAEHDVTASRTTTKTPLFCLVSCLSEKKNRSKLAARAESQLVSRLATIACAQRGASNVAAVVSATHVVAAVVVTAAKNCGNTDHCDDGLANKYQRCVIEGL